MDTKTTKKNMIKSNIGFCVWIIVNKLWGKERFGNKLRSQKWWKNRLENLTNQPSIKLNISEKEFVYGDNIPIPYEKEFDNSGILWWVNRSQEEKLLTNFCIDLKLNENNEA